MEVVRRVAAHAVLPPTSGPAACRRPALRQGSSFSSEEAAPAGTFGREESPEPAVESFERRNNSRGLYPSPAKAFRPPPGLEHLVDLPGHFPESSRKNSQQFFLETRSSSGSHGRAEHGPPCRAVGPAGPFRPCRMPPGLEDVAEESRVCRSEEPQQQCFRTQETSVREKCEADAVRDTGRLRESAAADPTSVSDATRGRCAEDDGICDFDCGVSKVPVSHGGLGGGQDPGVPNVSSSAPAGGPAASSRSDPDEPESPRSLFRRAGLIHEAKKRMHERIRLGPAWKGTLLPRK